MTPFISEIPWSQGLWFNNNTYKVDEKKNVYQWGIPLWLSRKNKPKFSFSHCNLNNRKCFCDLTCVRIFPNYLSRLIVSCWLQLGPPTLPGDSVQCHMSRAQFYKTTFPSPPSFSCQSQVQASGLINQLWIRVCWTSSSSSINLLMQLTKLGKAHLPVIIENIA